HDAIPLTAGLTLPYKVMAVQSASNQYPIMDLLPRAGAPDDRDRRSARGATGGPTRDQCSGRDGYRRQQARRGRDENEDERALRFRRFQRMSGVNRQRAQRESDHHAVERRSRRNRPALRDHVCDCEEDERSEHPDREQHFQEQRSLTTRVEHQTDRANRPGHDRDQRRCLEDAKESGHTARGYTSSLCVSIRTSARPEDRRSWRGAPEYTTPASRRR